MRIGAMGTCVVAAALAAGAGVRGAAAPGGGPDGAAAGRPLRMLLSGQFGRLLTLHSELQLTDEQREQIKTIVESHRAEIVAVAKPVVAKHRSLRDAVLADSTDEKAIRSAADDLGHSIGDAAVLAAKIKGEVHKVLTTDQQDKIEDFRKHADAAVDEFLQEISQAT